MAPPRAQQELSYSPVSRATIQDHVYLRMRELILTGGIEPGRTVTVQSLAEAFGVSAMPVREAMQRLVAEKALTNVAGRSVGIPFLSPERLDDLQRVRIEVEGTAIGWAAEAMPPDELGLLDDLIREMDEAREQDDRARYVPANRAFHFAIYRASGSDTLLSIIESLWLQIGPFFNLLSASDAWGASNDHHRVMRAAIAARDPAQARRALRRDIDDAAAMLRRLLGEETPAVARTKRRKAAVLVTP
ncbi:GntR family transcriptional regulator [Methylobacterium terricola]|uniref:GntR family transcriptional regulator n=1 Tax=Methylobacterium terricola TaxID=2583531 RepID=A0A5C4LBV3_9HYPH|nr:GntR family transcriptional regulator [Methylobacterium terricola]TNC09999.1 GntR family transcriptional regulator [Methylobacterium terricola]